MHIKKISDAYPDSLLKANIGQTIYNIYTGRIMQAFKGYNIYKLQH